MRYPEGEEHADAEEAADREPEMGVVQQHDRDGDAAQTVETGSVTERRRIGAEINANARNE